MTDINSDFNGINQTIVTNMTYRGDHQVLSGTYGNGLQDTRSYDLQGRLTRQLLTAANDTLIDERNLYL